MRPRDVREAVEAFLGHPVSRHSVNQVLSAHVPGRCREPRFVRSAPGQYVALFEGAFLQPLQKPKVLEC
jgi:hypothetical protein